MERAIDRVGHTRISLREPTRSIDDVSVFGLWFMVDGAGRKQSVMWCDAVSPEFKAIEDFDTLIRKYRVYFVMGNAVRGWRWILGASVS